MIDLCTQRVACILHRVKQHANSIYIYICAHAEAFFREVDEDEDVIGEETEQRGRGTGVGGVTEIVEDILAQLPIDYLYGNCRLVCRRWNEIILREKVTTQTLIG